jgi:cytochrome c oxidase subunit III
LAEQTTVLIRPETGPAVSEQFDTLEQEHSANVLGMWVFLATEVMLFGGMFLAYTVFSFLYSSVFEEASMHQNLTAGTINTAVLLISSLFVALAVRSAQTGNRPLVLRYLPIAMGLGVLFLCIKGFEYYQHWQDQLVPGLHYAYDGPEPAHAALFFFLYFVMTGLHAIHMTIGIGLLAFIWLRVRNRHYLGGKYTRVDVVGLYWHFVDIIWLFLFPLFYLIARR